MIGEKEQSGLTVMQLKLVDPPVNYQPYVPQTF